MKEFKKKVLFIGDVHGLTEWDNIAMSGLKNFYEIVFLGDYVDSFFVSAAQQIANLRDLITFLRKHQDVATALLGNHDYAYIYGYSGISGHQHYHIQEYRKIFQDNIDLFKIAWGFTGKDGKYTLATHAGLTSEFWNKFVVPEFNEGKWLHTITDGKKPDEIPMHETLNYLKDKGDVLWKVGRARMGAGTPGPLWADYTEVLDDPYPGINQVFGHTPRASVTVDHIDNNFLACVDSWGNKRIVSLLLPL